MSAYTFQPEPIRSLTYGGWTGAQRLQNPTVTLTAVPEIARIMQFSLTGSPNLIWQNPALEGQLADPQQTQQGSWRNFGGAKLWVAPQSAWNSTLGNWPPDYEIDSAPCNVFVKDPHTLILEGQPSPTKGVQYRREIGLVYQGADLIYTLTNVSDYPISWGIWMVFQAIPGGTVFLPATHDTQFWLDPQFSGLEATRPEDLSYQKQDQVYVLDHAQSIHKTKLFSISDQGWLAYWVADQVFFLLYDPDSAALYPKGEGSTEVFTDADYVELEHIGPLVHLDPDQSTSLQESWRILPAPDLPDLQQQITWVRSQVHAFAELK